MRQRVPVAAQPSLVLASWKLGNHIKGWRGTLTLKLLWWTSPEDAWCCWVSAMWASSACSLGLGQSPPTISLQATEYLTAKLFSSGLRCQTAAWMCVHAMRASGTNLGEPLLRSYTPAVLSGRVHWRPASFPHAMTVLKMQSINWTKNHFPCQFALESIHPRGTLLMSACLLMPVLNPGFLFGRGKLRLSY